jgi:DNA-directed RNA polymerase specialized sigma24 family protein
VRRPGFPYQSELEILAVKALPSLIDGREAYSREILRQVDLEGQPVSEAARAFGFSRPSFYQAQAAFEGASLVGLLPNEDHEADTS